MRQIILAVILVIAGGLLWWVAAARSVDPAQTFRLDYFPALPKAIDGCGETFTYDSVSLKKEKYIFVDNLQDQAFIFVRGKEIALKRTKHFASPGGKKFRDEYEGSGYKAILLEREVRETGDEGAYMEGTVEITYGQTTLKIKIHGEGGC